MTPIPTPTDHDDTKAPDGAFFNADVNKFGSVVPALGLSVDFSDLTNRDVLQLELSSGMKGLVTALTGIDPVEIVPMPEPLRRRAEVIRDGMWPEFPLDLAATVEIVRACHLQQMRPTHGRRVWLEVHSPELLAYLDTIATSNAWRTVADRWILASKAMDRLGMKATARVPVYEHIFRALPDMAAIGAIAVRKAAEELRAQLELDRQAAAAFTASLDPDQAGDQEGGETGGSGGQKAKPAPPAEPIETAAEDTILTAAEIAALGWGKPKPETKKPDTTDETPRGPGGGFKL